MGAFARALVWWRQGRVFLEVFCLNYLPLNLSFAFVDYDPAIDRFFVHLNASAAGNAKNCGASGWLAREYIYW